MISAKISTQTLIIQITRRFNSETQISSSDNYDRISWISTNFNMKFYIWYDFPSQITLQNKILIERLWIEWRHLHWVGTGPGIGPTMSGPWISQTNAMKNIPDLQHPSLRHAQLCWSPLQAVGRFSPWFPAAHSRQNFIFLSFCLFSTFWYFDFLIFERSFANYKSKEFC